MATTVLVGDFGGTNFRAALVASDGTVLSRHQAASPDTLELAPVLAHAIALLEAAAGDENPQAVCIAVAGLVNAEAGRVDLAPNIPAFRNAPITGPIAIHLGIPAFIENDASAAALGEYRFGAGRGSRHVLHATIGTGIGGGIIVDGRLYRGAGGLAGEIGHITVDPAGPRCACGGRGCLEAMVSGTAFAARAQRLIASGRAPLLASLAGEGPTTGGHLHAAAMAGEVLAEAEIRNGGHYLGLGIGSVVNVLNPDIVTLSGGMLAIGPMLLEPMRAAMLAMPYGPANRTPIRLSELDEDAGLLGAAAVALEHLGA